MPSVVRHLGAAGTSHWRALLAIAALAVLAAPAGTLAIRPAPSHGNIELAVEPPSASGKPGSHTFAIAVVRSRVVVGLLLGGPDLPRILEREGLVFLVDLDAGAVRKLSTLPLTKRVGCQSGLRVSDRWDGNDFFVTDYSCEHPDRVYRFSPHGSFSEVDALPTAASVPAGTTTAPFVVYSVLRTWFAGPNDVTMLIGVETEQWRPWRPVLRFDGATATLETVKSDDDPIAYSRRLQVAAVSEKPDSDLFVAVVRNRAASSADDVLPDERIFVFVGDLRTGDARQAAVLPVSPTMTRNLQWGVLNVWDGDDFFVVLRGRSGADTADELAKKPAEQILRMSPDGRFTAIDAIPASAKALARQSRIFGYQTAEVARPSGSAEALEQARKSLGWRREMLNKRTVLFEVSVLTTRGYQPAFRFDPESGVLVHLPGSDAPRELDDPTPRATPPDSPPGQTDTKGSQTTTLRK